MGRGGQRERGEKERERETPRAKRIMVLGGKNE